MPITSLIKVISEIFATAVFNRLLFLTLEICPLSCYLHSRASRSRPRTGPRCAGCYADAL